MPHSLWNCSNSPAYTRTGLSPRAFTRCIILAGKRFASSAKIFGSLFETGAGLGSTTRCGGGPCSFVVLPMIGWSWRLRFMAAVIPRNANTHYRGGLVVSMVLVAVCPANFFLFHKRTTCASLCWGSRATSMQTPLRLHEALRCASPRNALHRSAHLLAGTILAIVVSH